MPERPVGVFKYINSYHLDHSLSVLLKGVFILRKLPEYRYTQAACDSVVSSGTARRYKRKRHHPGKTDGLRLGHRL